MGAGASDRRLRTGASALVGAAFTGATLLASLGAGPATAAGPAPAPSPAQLGHQLVRDPVPRVDVHTRTAAADRALVRRAPYPLADTFALHSLPGSAHTILLDFNGDDVSGTAWNAPDLGLPDGRYRGWSLDGDPAFSDVERAAVQDIWQRVAEDFAPFDVDVTTQDPGPDALDRSSPDDPTYGTRAVITSSQVAARAICPDGCSGMAFFDVMDTAVDHAAYQPSWVFSDMVGNDLKDIAEVVSHEVGHNFGLLHDGTTTQEYSFGQGSWAPIMGGGFSRPIVQWSRGAYAGANNPQDDLALIAANGAPLRADEAGDTPDGAGPLPSGPAYITSDADTDVWSLGACSGWVHVAARPAPRSPNLDILLRLLEPDGTVVASANPPSREVTRDRATGMGAWLTLRLPPGRYAVSVEGVGHGGALHAYDGYGSVGAYTVRASGCAASLRR
ncbi:zinc-dependent metalloprotease family protein [Nocardioides sp. LS1]|uniref:zinc-dependent metalloprotease family protein n=1 Tax=Nocardioides sp. LS1 TaxID=1027620 RepID=UPI000F6230E1|nr:zinc-dependent metalloprotease family protein [Nocardioides sp. LS1]GCD90970.1 hypothetical protein NLS1_29760 [Nocardioides sp. LS1]